MNTNGVRCEHCKRLNPSGTILCMYCGEPVRTDTLPLPGKTTPLPEGMAAENTPAWGDACFEEGHALGLYVVHAARTIIIPHVEEKGLVLGRRDPQNGAMPDVDLTLFKAMALGVSRLHARIDIHKGLLRITDLGSLNGTSLNGFLLTPHQPRILRNADEIILGSLVLQVTFLEDTTDRALLDLASRNNTNGPPLRRAFCSGRQAHDPTASSG